MKLCINGIPGSLEITEVSCCKLVQVIKRFFRVPVHYRLTYNKIPVPGDYLMQPGGLVSASTGEVVTLDFILEALGLRYVLNYGLPEPLVLEKHISSDTESLFMMSWPVYAAYYGGLLEVPGRYWFDKDQRQLLVAGKHPREIVTPKDIQDLLGLSLT
jgi:hypothetical protein